MKVGIYCRLSEEDRDKRNKTDDSGSIQNQKSMLVKYAYDRGWEIYKIYSDDDYTGSDRSRPAFNELLRDAEERRIDTVLCKTQSRFTRELELVERYIHGLFPRWGVRFVSVVDNADTEIKGNKKARQINGLINEWYLEDMSDNIRSVLTNRIQDGLHIGAFALYGYRKDPDRKGHLIIDEPAAAVVREVFELFAQGYGKTAIARILNSRGIPNPTEYKRRAGLRFKQPSSQAGTLWKYYSISSMLKNEIYIGNMVQGRYASVSYKTKKNRPVPKSKWIVVPNTHEPIIDTELWNRVQRLLGERARPFTMSGKRGIFAQKVRCMYCGYILRSSVHHGERYLNCSTRYVSKESCLGCCVSCKTLEKKVLGELREMNEQYLDKGYIEQNAGFDQKTQEQADSLKKQMTEYNEQMAKSANAIRSLYIDKANGLITDDDFADMSREFHQSLSAMKTLIGETESKIYALQKKPDNSESVMQLIERYTDAESLTGDIVDSMIDYIEVGSRIPKSKERPITIHWNF